MLQKDQESSPRTNKSEEPRESPWHNRNTIDEAKDNQKELLITQLDVQQAYDSVPFDGLKLCLQRLKLPESFITLIMNMHRQRRIVISTEYGDTDEFTPT